MTKTAEKALAANFAEYVKRGPGLRFGTQAVVLERDPVKGWVHLGGLGGMGCGQMWVAEQPNHVDYPGYKEAPIVTGPEHLGLHVPTSWRFPTTALSAQTESVGHLSPVSWFDFEEP